MKHRLTFSKAPRRRAADRYLRDPDLICGIPIVLDV